MVTALGNSPTEHGGNAVRGAVAREQGNARCVLVVRARPQVNAEFAQALRSGLGQSWDMIAVGDLPTALRAAQLSGISAVVLDVGPGWTRHVTRLLCRGRNGAAPPRIVAVVGETGKALGEAAVELGAAAYITDGVASPARVAQAVRRVMGEPENAPTRAVTAVAVPSVPCYTLPGRGRSLASGTWLDEPVAVSPAMRQRLALAGAAQRCEDRATVGQLGDQGRRRPQSAPVMTTAAWHPVLAADRCAVA